MIKLVFSLGLISIFSISDIISDNNEIEIENENISIYSSKSYAPQIVEKCKNDIHCSVNAMNSIAKIETKEKVVDTFSELVINYEYI